jgi:4-amino-4-deoxy-L-arabinose transferase-like glycosyltransferase
MPRPTFRPCFGLGIILLFSFSLKLIHLDNPPLGIHSWRQSDTAAVARNFLRDGLDLLYPRIDWSGDRPAAVEMELPIYCAATAALALVTGSVPLAGRLLAAIASTLTVYFLFRLVRLFADRRTALWSAAVYAVLPLNLYYGRAIMPEAWMLAASTIGLYAFALWSRSVPPSAPPTVPPTGTLPGRWDSFRSPFHPLLPLTLSCLAISLAALLKLPALHLGLPLLWLAWRRLGPRCLISPAMWCYAACVFIPVLAWYLHAYHIGAQTGNSVGIWHSDKWGSLEPLLSPGWYYDVFLGKLSEDHLTWAGLIILLFGLALGRTRSRLRFFHVWTLGALISIFIVPIGHRAHEYYQLPIVLPLAPFLGAAFAALQRRHLALVLLFLLPLLGLSAARYARYLKRESPARAPEYALALALRQVTQADDLVIIANGPLWGDPTVLYSADRKGWALPISRLDGAAIDALAARGAVVVAGLEKNLVEPTDRHWYEAISARFTPAADVRGAFIFRLAP